MMMIKRIGVTAATVLVAGALLTPAASAATAPATERAATGVTPDSDARNGGDYGIGNCGFNASGGNWDGRPLGGANPGLGGFKKGDACFDLSSGSTFTFDLSDGLTI